MSFLRAIVVTVVLLSAMPAVAQTPVGPEGMKRKETPEVRTFVANYNRIFGRFIYGRTLFDWPRVQPRIVWVVDRFITEGRPLGFSASAYGFPSYGMAQPAWNGWPYVSTGGRDEAPRAPLTARAESESAVEEGRARWRAGDPAGALSGFKRAVAADLSNGAARLLMALALLDAGDEKNADKAVASALESIRVSEELTALKVDELFRGPKGRAKFQSKLVPAADGSGRLAIALAQHLLGLKAKAVTTLEGLDTPSAGFLRGLLK